MNKYIIVLTLLLTATAQANTSLKTEHWQTDKGSEVIFYQSNEVPMVEINIAFRSGSAYDSKQFGISYLTTELLNQGSGSFNATQIAEKLANVGAQYQSKTTRDMSVINLKSLSTQPNLTDATETLSLILGKPQFKTQACNQKKNQQLMLIAQQQESPNDVAALVFYDKLYQQHPYAHSVLGTAKTVAALSPNKVNQFYQQYFVANNAVVVIVGAIDSTQAHRLAETITAFLKPGKKAADIPQALPLAQEEKVAIPFPSSQTMLLLGQVGISYTVPDYFPLQVGNYILGGGVLVSKLAVEVREKRGLTYGVVSRFMPLLGNGPFLISLSTKNKQAAEALNVTETVLHEFLEQGPTEQELQAAKKYLIGSFPLNLSSNSNIASLLLKIAFYHLPADYLDTYITRIESVNSNEVKKAFTKQIHPKKMLLVSVGQS